MSPSETVNRVYGLLSLQPTTQVHLERPSEAVAPCSKAATVHHSNQIKTNEPTNQSEQCQIGQIESKQAEADRKFRRDQHEFIDQLCNYLTNPNSWPLTQHEQAAFVRTVLFQARKIEQSEPFAREAIVFTAEDLVMGS